MNPTFLYIGPLRWWIGRGGDGVPASLRKPDGNAKGIVRYAQLLLALLLTMGIGILASEPWNIALTKALGLVVLIQWAGHSPMIDGPGLVLPSRLKGPEKWIYDALDFLSSAEIRWWAFGMCRYVIPAIVLDLALVAQGNYNGYTLIPASWLLVGTYRLTWALRRVLRSPFKPGGDDHTQFSEVFGWTPLAIAYASI